MVKYKKLNGKIVEKFETRANFAEEIKSYRTYVARKLMGETEFKLSDIKEWSDALQLTNDEILECFDLKREKGE